jgi:hypothetical protein
MRPEAKAAHSLMVADPPDAVENSGYRSKNEE